MVSSCEEPDRFSCILQDIPVRIITPPKALFWPFSQMLPWQTNRILTNFSSSSKCRVVP